jgi:ribonuclease HII
VVKESVMAEHWSCGIDEAGRGPIAGPVTAGAVVLAPDFPVDVLGDSKSLSRTEREAAESLIKEHAVAWALGWATHEEIDSLNILQASLLAMRRAVDALRVRPDELLVDGLYCPATSLPCRAIIKGDATVPAIMAASIIAKTARDAWMEAYAVQEPLYHFEKHKGYPTEEHRAIVLSVGPSRIQRRTFKVTSPS